MEMVHYSDAVDYIADTQHGARITDSLVGFFFDHLVPCISPSSPLHRLRFT